ncbi:hypothetical protein JCM5353_004860 [Sporobolomyces roseus]
MLNFTIQASLPGFELKGQCLICNKETTRRCSACARHGTMWMYFCSEEHQRLIWSIHKRICGAFSRPFHFPPLTQEEIDEIVKIKDEPCRDADDEITTLQGSMNQQVKERHPEAPDDSEFPVMQAAYRWRRRQSQKSLLTCSMPLDGSPLPMKLSRAVPSIRGRAFIAKSTSGAFFEKKPSIQEREEMTLNSPFDYLASLEYCCMEHVTSNPESYPWLTDLQHHLVILLALHRLMWKHRNERAYHEQLFDYRQHSFARILKYLEAVVKPVNPEVAKKIVEMLACLGYGTKLPWHQR